jgi:DNA-binding beta-propeller fold protein YncE
MSPQLRQKKTHRPMVEDLEARALLSGSILDKLTAAPPALVSTIPPSGDLNPYGVTFVPAGFPKGGTIHPGDILVSNFNASSNLQGTGSTIIDVSPKGNVSTYFQGTPGLGLTSALNVLKAGYVLVGSLPTTDGTAATLQQGSLLLLDKHGNEVASIASGPFLDGPWGMTVDDHGSHASVFISNVLNGTVTRVDLGFGRNGITTRAFVIGSGYGWRTDPAALVIGPTGLAFDAKHDVLYVASTLDNEVFAVPNAERTFTRFGTGKLVYQDDVHLHGPLGLVLAPNGNLIVANGDALNADPAQQSELVEFTPRGRFVSQFSIQPDLPAALFGIAINTSSTGLITLAAVNDDTNQLELFSVQGPRKK